LALSLVIQTHSSRGDDALARSVLRWGRSSSQLVDLARVNGDRPPTPADGSNLPIRDVRSSVATGGKPDKAQKAGIGSACPQADITGPLIGWLSNRPRANFTSSPILGT